MLVTKSSLQKTSDAVWLGIWHRCGDIDAPWVLAVFDLAYITEDTYGCSSCRNTLAKDNWPKLEGVTSLYDLFEQAVSKFGNHKCLGWRPQVDGKAQAYSWHTFKETQGSISICSLSQNMLPAHPSYSRSLESSNKSRLSIDLYVNPSAVFQQFSHKSNSLEFQQCYSVQPLISSWVKAKRFTYKALHRAKAAPNVPWGRRIGHWMLPDVPMW